MAPFVPPAHATSGHTTTPQRLNGSAGDSAPVGDAFAEMISPAPDSQPTLSEYGREPAPAAEPRGSEERTDSMEASESAAPESVELTLPPTPPSSPSEDPELLSLLAALAGLGAVAPPTTTSVSLSLSQMFERETAALLPAIAVDANSASALVAGIATDVEALVGSNVVPVNASAEAMESELMASPWLDPLATTTAAQTAADPDISGSSSPAATVLAAVSSPAATELAAVSSPAATVLAAVSSPPIPPSVSSSSVNRTGASQELPTAAFDGLHQNEADVVGVTAALAKQADAALNQPPPSTGTSVGSDTTAMNPTGATTPQTRLSAAPETLAQPPAAQPNSSERAVANQVARAVLRHQPNGGDILVLRLTPPELGTVRIEFTSRNGILSARMVAEDEAVRRALERALPHMKADLRSEHANLDIRVDRGDQRWGWQEGGQRQDQRDPRSNSEHRRRDGDPIFTIDGSETVVSQSPVMRADPVLGSRISALAVDALA